MPTLVRLLFILLAPLLLFGCSEMQFASTPAATEEDDGREDMHLTGVVTDMTSSGLVQNRIVSDKAIYSERKSLLVLNDVQVHSFGEAGQAKGVTSAKKGTVYLANQKIIKGNKTVDRHKDDLEFAGNVQHRALKKDDPTTDTMRLNTEELLWSEADQRFKTNAFYRMLMYRPNQPPMIAMGDGFTATQDMRSWLVRYGGLSTTGDPNAREAGEIMRKNIKTEVEARERGHSTPVLQKPIDLPVIDGAAPPPAAPITVPPGLDTASKIPAEKIQVPPAIDAAAQQTPAGKIEIPPEMERAQEQIVGGRKVYRLTIPPPQAAPAAPSASPTPRRTPAKTPVSADVEKAMRPGTAR